MAFGAGASAKQWAKEAKREASAIRRYWKPFAGIAVVVWAWIFYTPIMQDGGLAALPDPEIDSLTFRAIAITAALWVGWVWSFGRLQRGKVQVAKAAAGRREHGAKGEVAMGRHLAPLMTSKWYGVFHDRLIFKNDRGEWTNSNWDHWVVTPSGVKMPDTKNYSAKAKWEIEGADCMYDGRSIRPNIQTANNAVAEVVKALRAPRYKDGKRLPSIEQEIGKQIPVEACLAIYPHMRLKHGGYMSAKNVDGVLVMRFRDVRGWCMNGERLFSPKEIKMITKHLKDKFPPAAKSKR